MISLRRFFIVAAFALPAISAQAKEPESAHNFSFTAIEGHALPMADFAGQAVLLANTASFCGFTPQFEALQALWADYRDRGLVVLGAPSRDFGGHDYADAAQSRAFCEAAYGVDFPMTDTVRVRGASAHPLYLWLAGALEEQGIPRWNFHKILIDAAGAPVAGFPSRVEPTDPVFLAAVEGALPR
ncbi:MAG: glutathione peroxidase [Pseudomonadota bacterium]